jgi:hypothetical protein
LNQKSADSGIPVDSVREETALGFDLDHQLPRRHVRNDNDRHWIFVFGDAGRRSRVTKIVKPIVRCAINPNLKRTLDEL